MMRKIVVSEFVTLDGVMQDPGGTGEFALGGWAFKAERGPEGDRFKFDELFAADALLLGRITYEGFAKAWPGMQRDEAGFTDRMNAITKYVVSSTLREAKWNNSHIIKGNVAREIQKLKEMDGKDILVAGSGMLVQALIQNDLVDELRLMVYPFVLGTGKRLFQDGSRLNLKLESAKPLNSKVLIMTYSAEHKG
jgi:dihydrofolate reductase